MKDYIPLLQTLAWIILIIYAIQIFRTKLDGFLSAFVRRIETGSSFEAGPVKLGEDLRDLEEKVAATEESHEHELATAKAVKATGDVGWEQFFNEFFKIVNSQSSNIEKVLTTSILVEQMVANVGVAYGVGGRDQRLSPRQVIDALANQNVITHAERDAFVELWTIRNKVVHGDLGAPSNEQITKFLDLAWRLVRTLA